ncbi:MAG: hypothetical protein AAF367_17995 [Pseudomonadota bacterium]
MFRMILTAFVFVALTGSARAETFNFQEEGFSITTPQGWEVLSFSETAKMVERSDFGSDLKRSGRADSSILTVTEDRNAPGVSPGIFVNKYPGEISDISVGLNNVRQFIEQNTRDFVLIEGPTPDPLGGFDAAYMRYSYVVNVGAGDLDVIEKFWLIPLGDEYLTISAGAAPGAPPQVLEAIEAAAKSLTPL